MITSKSSDGFKEKLYIIKGKVSFTWSEDIVTYISQLERRFTQYRLADVAKLNTSYAIRIYELLMRFNQTSHQTSNTSKNCLKYDHMDLKGIIMIIKEKLKSAIDARNIISFQYKGHHRIAEPYHYGDLIRTPKHDPINPPKENYFFCYQTGGTSASGKIDDYKTMDLKLIINFKIEKETFEVRDNYDPESRQWDIMYGVATPPPPGYKA